MVNVSVIMPAYDAAETIDRAIDSALDQTLGDLEVIVVDDGSRDATVDLVRRREAADRRVRLLRMAKNGGPAAARNAALDVARGEWVALLDADDAWRPDRLATLTAVGGYDFVADQILGYDDAAGVETGPFMRRSFAGDVDLMRLLKTGSGYDFGFLQPIMRRAFLESIILRYPVTLRHGEDLVFYVRALAAGARFRVLPYGGYLYTTPRGRRSGVVSPHSHTRPDKTALAAALEAVAAEYAARITPAERDAFAWRADFYRTRIAFDTFVDACRRREAGAAIASFAAAPITVSRHLARELWLRYVPG